MIGEFKIEVLTENAAGAMEVDPGLSNLFTMVLDNSLIKCEENAPAFFNEEEIDLDFWQGCLWDLNDALEGMGYDLEMREAHPEMPPALVFNTDAGILALQLRHVFPDSIEELV
jgi:hypothetical protein